MANNDQGVLGIEVRIQSYVKENLSVIEGQLRSFSEKTATEARRQVQQNKDVERSVGTLAAAYDPLRLAVSGAVAAFGGMAILSKVRAFLVESTIEIKKQQTADALLESATGSLSRRLAAFASEQQRLTTAADDEIQAVEATIGAFIKNEAMIKRITVAALDMQAAGKGNAQTMADLLTKSIVSSTNALSRYGIKLGENLTIEQKYKEILQQVERAWGGRAQAIAQTDTGKLQQTANLLGDVKETIGKEILPLQLEWNNAVLGLVTTLSGPLAGTLRDLTGAFRLMAGTSRDTLQADVNIKYAASLEDRVKAQNYLFTLYGKEKKEVDELRRLYEAAQKAYGAALNDTKSANVFIKGSGVMGLRLAGEDLEKYGKKLSEAEAILARYHTALRNLNATERQAAADAAAGGPAAPDDPGTPSGKTLADAKRALAEAEANNLRDSLERQRALEQLRYEQELRDFEGVKGAKELVTQAHLARLEGIEVAYADRVGRAVAEKAKAWAEEDARQRLRVMQDAYARYKAADEEDVRVRYTTEQAAFRLRDEARINAIKDTNARQLALEEQRYQDELRMYGATQRAKEALTQAHEARLDNLQKNTYEDTVQRAVSLVGIIGDANRRTAQERKNIAAAEAGINTAVAATKALPNWFDVALVLAAGFAQQAKIRNTKFAGGLVGEYGENGMEVAINPTLNRIRPGTQIFNNSETKNLFGGTNVHVNLPGADYVDTERMRRWLVDALPAALDEAYSSLRLETFKSRMAA